MASCALSLHAKRFSLHAKATNLAHDMFTMELSILGLSQGAGFTVAHVVKWRVRTYARHPSDFLCCLLRPRFPRCNGAKSRLDTKLLMKKHAAPMQYLVQRAGLIQNFVVSQTIYQHVAAKQRLVMLEMPHLHVAQAQTLSLSLLS